MSLGLHFCIELLTLHRKVYKLCSAYLAGSKKGVEKFTVFSPFPPASSL
jgi:hypothetical protein